MFVALFKTDQVLMLGKLAGGSPLLKRQKAPHLTMLFTNKVKVIKGKAIPLQAWTGP
jgi:hypothetical protein